MGTMSESNRTITDTVPPIDSWVASLLADTDDAAVCEAWGHGYEPEEHRAGIEAAMTAWRNTGRGTSPADVNRFSDVSGLPRNVSAAVLREVLRTQEDTVRRQLRDR